jgi:microcystin-dependent protein
MDAIDGVFDGYVPKPSGIVTGEVPVWNGTTWVRSSVTNIGASSLGSGTPDGTKFLRGDGTWAVPTVSGMETGALVPYAGVSVPSGYLLCDGSAVSKTTYSGLWSALSANKGTFTVTIASPGVVTLNAHGFVGGERVYLTTTGALPTGLAVDTNYWVIYVDANTFRLASSQANYLSSTAINTSGSQSGTHTLFHSPYGVSGSTNFLLPDLLGRIPVGASGSGGKVLVRSAGIDDGRSASVRSISHRHTVDAVNNTNTGGSRVKGDSNSPANQVTSGDADNVDYPAFQVVRFIIKT